MIALNTGVKIVGLEYEYSKTGAAVKALAESAEPIQKRLYVAWEVLSTLSAHGIASPERQAEFTSINDRLNLDIAGNRAGVENVTRNLGDEEAEVIAADITALNSNLMYDRIHFLEGEVRDLKRKE